MSEEHDRIWLEPSPGADEDYGRQWCQHPVWGDEGVEYVRADLIGNYLDRRPADGDAIDAIQRLMADKGLKRKDLFPAKSRASECMSRKRPLSIAMIRKLHFEHGIPAEILIAPYRVIEEQP